MLRPRASLRAPTRGRAATTRCARRTGASSPRRAPRAATPKARGPRSMLPNESDAKLHLVAEFQRAGVHRKGHVGLRCSAEIAQPAISTGKGIAMRVERFYDVISQLNREIQPADKEILGAHHADLFLEPCIGALPDQRGGVGGSVLFPQL